MSATKEIVDQFREEYGNISYREISQMTGIQMTRVFRIFNNSEMKASEYEKFREIILLKKEGAGKVAELFELNLLTFRPKFIEKVENLIKREVRLARFLKNEEM